MFIRILSREKFTFDITVPSESGAMMSCGIAFSRMIVIFRYKLTRPLLIPSITDTTKDGAMLVTSWATQITEALIITLFCPVE